MIPKSLHTVSTLVSVARIYTARPFSMPVPEALRAAVDALGYADAPDVHGLCAVAFRKLEKAGSK